LDITVQEMEKSQIRSAIPIFTQITREQFINLANRRHKLQYNYENTTFKNLSENVIINCPQHGDFTRIAHQHINNLSAGCSACIDEKKQQIRKSKLANFIADAKATFPTSTYDYDDTEFVNAATTAYVKIRCRKHQRHFNAHMNEHLNGKSSAMCASCYFDSRHKINKNLKKIEK
jgi:hypothetical protein